MLDSFGDFFLTNSDIKIWGFCFNEFLKVDGIGSLISNDLSQYSFINQNNFTNNSGTSLYRGTLQTNSYTVFSYNFGINLDIKSTFVQLDIDLNEGPIIFEGNNFTKLNVEAIEGAFRRINFIYVEAGAAHSVDGSDTTLYYNNNTITDSSMNKDQILIKPYQNSFIVFNLAQNKLKMIDSDFISIRISDRHNLIKLISEYVTISNILVDHTQGDDVYGAVYILA